MSLFLLGALLASSAPIFKPEENEIRVIGQRFSQWSGKYQIRGSRIKCSTKNSTKDPEIDAIGCEAFSMCAVALQPRIAASDDKALDRNARLALKSGIKHDLGQCVQQERTRLIAALATRRAAR